MTEITFVSTLDHLWLTLCATRLDKSLVCCFSIPNICDFLFCVGRNDSSSEDEDDHDDQHEGSIRVSFFHLLVCTLALDL